jgi:DNA-directed RNA polymerase subunit N (RpoN/RPB10)
MPCHVLCPSCGGGLAEVYDFIDLAKQGYYKSLSTKESDSIKTDKLELCPDVALPIGFILDAAGLNLLCCRMHILGVTNFDKVYK